MINANETKICSITGKPYVGFGNNAWPFEGRCSDYANAKFEKLADGVVTYQFNRN